MSTPMSIHTREDSEGQPLILSPTSAGAKRWGAANAPQLGPMSKRTHVRYVICLHALVLTIYTYVYVRRETLRVYVRTYVGVMLRWVRT